MKTEIGTSKFYIEIIDIIDNSVVLKCTPIHMDGRKEKPWKYKLAVGDTLTLSARFDED